MIEKDLKLPDVNLLQGLSLYTQYQKDEVCVAFFKFLKKYIVNNAEEKIKLLKQTSFRYEGGNTYLQFYYQYLWGIVRKFGEPKIRNLYDTKINYDTGLIYDDATFDGFLQLSYYKILLKFFTDYSTNYYTLDWLYRLVQEFCELESSQITITCNYDNVVVNCPRSTASVLLQRVFLDKRTYANVPICDIKFNFI